MFGCPCAPWILRNGPAAKANRYVLMGLVSLKTVCRRPGEASDCDAIGLDWTTDVAVARASVGSRVALQGNLDPQVLLSTPRAIESQAAAILRAAGPGAGFVFNLGHGIVPETPPEHVALLVDFVHEESRRAAEGKRAENRMDP